MFLIVLVGRILAVLIAHFLFRACCHKGPPDVKCNELVFIIYGGMIRGAIAFGLVLKISDEKDDKGVPDYKERGIIVTTTLALVIITTVLFGSFMPVIQKLLVPSKTDP
jgi:NhaP-type Na+/H+ or K+/H+ antiporter